MGERGWDTDLTISITKRRLQTIQRKKSRKTAMVIGRKMHIEVICLPVWPKDDEDA